MRTARSPYVPLNTLFDCEVKEVSRLLRPGSRRRIEALAKLRSLAIVEGAFQGENFSQGSRTGRARQCMGFEWCFGTLVPPFAGIAGAPNCRC